MLFGLLIFLLCVECSFVGCFGSHKRVPHMNATQQKQKGGGKKHRNRSEKNLFYATKGEGNSMACRKMENSSREESLPPLFSGSTQHVRTTAMKVGKIFIALFFSLPHSVHSVCGFFTKNTEKNFLALLLLLIVCYLIFSFVPDIYNDKGSGHRMSIKLLYGHSYMDQ